MILVYPKVALNVSRDSYTFKSVQTCTAKSKDMNQTQSSQTELTVLDYKIPLFVQAGLLAIASIFFVLGFKCSYLRLKAEAEKREKEKYSIVITSF